MSGSWERRLTTGKLMEMTISRRVPPPRPSTVQPLMRIRVQVKFLLLGRNRTYTTKGFIFALKKLQVANTFSPLTELSVGS